MKIPENLLIGAQKWTIKEVDHGEIGDEECYGDLNYKTGVIRIVKHMNQDSKERTFFHEVLHAINTELDHVTIDALALSIHQVFKQIEEKNETIH